jgi:methyl-accepting chemotaxis protein
MTDDELKALVANLAIATTRNTEAIDRNAAAIDRNATAIDRNATAIDRNATAISSLTQRFEDMRESLSYNTQAVADGLELAAASNRTAAAAMELSANTSRNLDRLEQDIADLQQMMGIVIRDNQADRSRINRLEE